MKRNLSFNTAFSIGMILTTLVTTDTLAVTFGTQDLFIIDSLRIDSGGMEIDITPTLISNSISSPESTVTFAGGATFTSTSIFQGQVIDINNFILGNTTVNSGILSFDGNQFFSLLVSSNIDAKAETLGISDSVEIDLTTVLPDDVNIGDIGQMDYALIQFTSPSNPSSEFNLSPLEVAVSRSNSNEGLVFGPSVDGSTLAQIFGQPFVVSEGSKGWRYFGKGLTVAGGTTIGSLTGAGIGSAIPGLGTTAGAIVGGAGGFLTSLGTAIVNNTDGDDTPDPQPPNDLIPDTSKAKKIPEATSIPSFLAFGTLGAASTLKRKLKPSNLTKKG